MRFFRRTQALRDAWMEFSLPGAARVLELDLQNGGLTACPAKKRGDILSLTYDPSYPGLEIIYLLGRFSIQADRKITVGDFPKRLTLGDGRQHGLLFYGGHIQYSFSVNHEPGSKEKAVLCCPDYAGAALRIAVNGEKKGMIA